jgi:hypothetical protein
VAAAVRADEINGYGSSAHWAGDAATSAPRAKPAAPPKVGERVELARYSIASGSRILYGQRVDGVVRVIDKPAANNGRSYLVERGLTSNDELEALVADYVDQSRKRDEPAALPAH